MPERYLGRQLGRFRIDALLGAGGFAWVYRGYDPELDIPVAIKLLKPQFAGDEIFEARFRHEASIAAKLRHPNIIHIFDVGREGTAVYLVMDFLSTELTTLLGTDRTLPEPLLLAMGKDVAAALAFAHREGVIHRDIKADNILYDDHGNAIVADFGIARAVSSYVEATGSDMLVGTPQYLSPEQARSRPLDGRSDLYSLGVTLYRAASGLLPFRGDDWYELLRQHVEERPRPPREINPMLSEELERIILKCLEKEPANRFPTADALRKDLAQLLRSTTTPVTWPSPPAGMAVSAGDTMGTAVTRAVVPEIASPARARQIARRGILAAAGTAAVAASALIWQASRSHLARPPAPPPVALEMHELPAIIVLAPASYAAESAAVAPGRELRIDVPPGAVVTVDSVQVGTGAWQSDSIAPGAHVIAARVSSVPRCPSAREVKQATVAAEGPSIVTLTPRPCGYLALDAKPAAVRYALADTAGKVIAHGALRARSRVVVPAGRYALRVSAPYCADFTATVTISAGATRRERVRLICR